MLVTSGICSQVYNAGINFSFLLITKLKLFEQYKIYRSAAQTPSPELLSRTVKVQSMH